MKIPAAGSSLNKYNLDKIKPYGHKDFPLSQWKGVRDAAYRTGKKIGCQFATRKIEVKGKTVIRVYRDNC